MQNFMTSSEKFITNLKKKDLATAKKKIYMGYQFLDLYTETFITKKNNIHT